VVFGAVTAGASPPPVSPPPVSPPPDKSPESKSGWTLPGCARPRRPPEANRSVEGHIRPAADRSFPAACSPGATFSVIGGGLDSERLRAVGLPARERHPRPGASARAGRRRL